MEVFYPHHDGKAHKTRSGWKGESKPSGARGANARGVPRVLSDHEAGGGVACRRGRAEVWEAAEGEGAGGCGMSKGYARASSIRHLRVLRARAAYHWKRYFDLIWAADGIEQKLGLEPGGRIMKAKKRSALRSTG